MNLENNLFWDDLERSLFVELNNAERAIIVYRTMKLDEKTKVVIAPMVGAILGDVEKLEP